MFPQPLNYHSPEGARKCLVMENIPDHWKEIELFQIFHSFGSIKNVQLIKKLNASGTHFCQYGIIQFQNQDSAHNALVTLQGQLFNGFVIRLSWAEELMNSSNHTSPLLSQGKSPSSLRSNNPSFDASILQVGPSFTRSRSFSSGDSHDHRSSFKNFNTFSDNFSMSSSRSMTSSPASLIANVDGGHLHHLGFEKASTSSHGVPQTSSASFHINHSTTNPFDLPPRPPRHCQSFPIFTSVAAHSSVSKSNNIGNPERKTTTAQVHFSYVSNRQTPVTIEELRSVFARFGQIVTVTLKKSQLNKETNTQTGYGFVHYCLTPEGISAAIECVKQMEGMVHDSVKYSSSLSHALKAIIDGIDGGNNPSTTLAIGSLAPSSAHSTFLSSNPFSLSPKFDIFH